VKVVKFGGTSLQTSERITTVVDIVRECVETARVVVVVSAIGGVTNALNAAATDSASGEPAELDDLLRLHLDVLTDLSPEEEVDERRVEVEQAFAELKDLCRGVALLRECSARTRDAILSHGERLSALIVAAGLRRGGVDATGVDARSLIVTDDTFGGARVDNDSTVPRIVDGLGRPGAVPVVTGFIAATRHGDTTTLGRGGSDYTAALLGSALHADVVEIWTDVDGVMSADPRMVSGNAASPS
jgi:aspartokinase/homoserine dehydrogenase 1